MTSTVENKHLKNHSRSMEDWPILEKTKLIQLDTEVKSDKNDNFASKSGNHSNAANSKRRWEKLNVDFKYTSSDNVPNNSSNRFNNNNNNDAQVENKENFQQKSGYRGGRSYRNYKPNSTERGPIKDGVENVSPDKNRTNESFRPPRQSNKNNNNRNENWQSETNENTEINKSPQKNYRPAAGSRGKRNYTGRGRNSSRYSQVKSNENNFNPSKNIEYLPLYSNYSTGIPLIMSTFNNQVSEANAGIMTTVSAGSLYNNQILFLPSVSSSLPQNIDYNSLVPLHPEMIPFQNETSVEVNNVLIKQVEYYFSEENLHKDTYLRSQMDPEGWVSLMVISTFKRIANFGMDVYTIAQILTNSKKLEVDTKNLQIRLVQTNNNNNTNNNNKTKDVLIILNPDAPEFVPQNENTTEQKPNKQEELNFAFEVENHDSLSLSSKHLTVQERNRLALQAKLSAKQNGRQRLNSSIISEDDVDDNMLPFLLIITPESPDISEPEVKFAERKPSKSNQNQIFKAVLEKHPGGDRKPHYIPKSKMNTELEGIIKLGLEEYERDFRSKNVINKSSRSRTSSTSESKVNLVSRQEFEALSQTLTDVCLNSDKSDKEIPPVLSIRSDNLSVSVSDTVFPSFSPMVPTLIGIPATNDSFYPPGTYMYFPPVVAGQPAHLTLVPQIPLSVSLCDSGTSQKQDSKSKEEAEDPLPLKSILKKRIDSDSKPKSSARQIAGFFPAGSDRYANEKQSKQRRQRLYSEGENLQLETHVGFAFDTKNNVSRSRTTSASSDSEVVKDPSSLSSTFGMKNHKSHAILKANGFTFQGYIKFRAYALRDREIHGIGLSQEMNTLYRFWSFFLRENFNMSMFHEFRSLAIEDADKNSRYGLECLFRFYSYGLEIKFRKSLFRNFEEDTLKDYNIYKHKYGLEKFWAFLFYSKKKIDINPRLSELLEKYKTLEDIRANFIPPDGFFIDRNRVRTTSEISNN